MCFAHDSRFLTVIAKLISLVVELNRLLRFSWHHQVILLRAAIAARRKKIVLLFHAAFRFSISDTKRGICAITAFSSSLNGRPNVALIKEKGNIALYIHARARYEADQSRKLHLLRGDVIKIARIDRAQGSGSFIASSNRTLVARL